jgi:hypothetical protein
MGCLKALRIVLVENMSQEIFSEDCEDLYHRGVRLVQLIGDPEKSRLEVMIFNHPSGAKENVPDRPNIYYQIKVNAPARMLLQHISSNKINNGYVSPPNRNWLPSFDVRYTDNGFGWYSPKQFACIEHYLLQRMHELVVIGSQHGINELNLYDAISSSSIRYRFAYTDGVMNLLREHCKRRGWLYLPREPMPTVKLSECFGDALPSVPKKKKGSLLF